MAASFFFGRSSVSKIVGQDLDSKICVASFEKKNQNHFLFNCKLLVMFLRILIKEMNTINIHE